MLYQTVPSFHPFQINSNSLFFSSPLLLQLSSSSHNLFLLLISLPSFHLSLSQGRKTEMECVEAKALKNSFRPAVEMSLKSNQQVVFEDIISGGSVPLVGVGVGVGGDETFVDDFLDFSNEDVENEQGGLVVVVKDDDDDDEEEEEEDGLSSQKQDDDNTHNSSNGVSPKTDVFGSELSVPTDDLADLEWLSHFVEDSFSEFSLQHLPGNPSEKTGPLSTQKPETGTGTPLSKKPVDFPIPIPARARSKRSRAVRVWSIGGSSSVTENSSSSSTTSTSSSSSSCLIFNNSGNQNLECFEYFDKPPAMKRQRKKKQGIMVYSHQLQQPIRRCSHCGVQKTPQWRAGPNGAKTLCNACGVRFKSGRLLPEYRPACSPTFSSDVHSNNHRKVLEMRKKKEIGPKESGFAPAVHSF